MHREPGKGLLEANRDKKEPEPLKIPVDDDSNAWKSGLLCDSITND